jgi:hypothetical protein
VTDFRHPTLDQLVQAPHRMAEVDRADVGRLLRELAVHRVLVDTLALQLRRHLPGDFCAGAKIQRSGRRLEARPC